MSNYFPTFTKWFKGSTETTETKSSYSSNSIFAGSNDSAVTSYSDSKGLLFHNTVDIVYKGIDLLATNFSNVRMVVKEETREGYKEVPDHPLQKLLDKPNGLQLRSKFQYTELAWRIINGNAFTWLQTIGGNSDYSRPVRMYAMPSSSISLMDQTQDWYYQLTAPQGFVGPVSPRFDLNKFTGESNIINWATFSTSSFTQGMSPLEPLNKNVEIYDNANDWNATYFNNGCRPSLAFINDDKAFEFSPADLKEFQRHIDQRFSGTGNNDKPIVLQGIKPQLLSTNPKDADFIQSLQQQELAIARGLGIPPILLNSGQGSTYANKHEAKLSLWDETLIPTCDSYAEELNARLTYRYPGKLKIIPDYSNVQALNQRRMDMYSIAKDATHLSLNERRKLTGQDPVVGGDIVPGTAESTSE